MTTLSDRIKSLMKDPPLGVSEMAAIAGVKPPSVSDWLNGKTKTLKSSPAIRLSKHFKIHLTWLTEGIGPKNVKTDPLPANSFSAATPEAPPYITNFAAQKSKREIALEEIIGLISQLNDSGLSQLTGMAKLLLAQQPAKQTQKLSG